MMRPDPVALPGLAALMIGFLAFVIALIVARTRRNAEGERGGTVSRRSRIGVAVQGLGIFVVAFGPQAVTRDPLSTKALVEAAMVALLMAGTVGLFLWASAAMGRNWSIVARTRTDHALVTAGPFAHIRHPIYTALFALMLAIAIAFGHTDQLLLGVPLFALGTWLRIAEEERLLRAMFGPAYEAYAGQVSRFVPGVF